MRGMEAAAMRGAAAVMGALPDGLGQFRLAQRWWHARRPASELRRQRLADGPVLELDLGDRTQALAYLTRRYARQLVRHIVDRLPADGVFLDVGANVGLVTFQVAVVRPHARIVAFEPFPANVESWTRNRDLNRSTALLMPVAVSDAPGSASFTVSSDRGSGHLTVGGELRVSTTTLDHVCAEQDIETVDVLKIDVEGGEVDVLRGAQQLLSRGAIRAVLCELNEPALERAGSSVEELDALLTSAGLRRLPLTHERRALRRRADDDGLYVLG